MGYKCIHRSLPLDPILSHLNPEYTFKPYLLKIHFNIILLSTPIPPKWLLNLREFIFPIPATPPAQLILHDLASLIIFGEEYKLRSSLLCNFLHPPVNFPLLSRNILLALSSQAPLHSSYILP